MTTAIVAVYLLGMVAILAYDDHLKVSEVVALAAWPALIPAAAVRRKYRRVTGTCKTCGHWAGSRKALRTNHYPSSPKCGGRP